MCFLFAVVSSSRQANTALHSEESNNMTQHCSYFFSVARALRKCLLLIKFNWPVLPLTYERPFLNEGLFCSVSNSGKYAYGLCLLNYFDGSALVGWPTTETVPALLVGFRFWKKLINASTKK